MFYTTTLTQDTVELLRSRGYIQYEPAIEDDNGSDVYHLMINKHDGIFWIICPYNLQVSKEQVPALFNEELNSTTHKEIMSWQT